MFIQIGSLVLVGAAAYYLCTRILSTSPMLAPYPFVVWSAVLLLVLVAFVVPVIISHLPRNYVIQLNPNYWKFTALMIAFVAAFVLMLLSDIFFYFAGSHILPVTISQIMNYRPIFIFGTALLMAALFF
jgi:hypothetical protein